MSQTRLFHELKNGSKTPLELLICEDLKEAHALESVAKFFGRESVVFPDFRASFGDDLRSYKEELHELFSALRLYYNATEKPLVISPLKTLLFPLPKRSCSVLKNSLLQINSISHILKSRCSIGVTLL